MSKDQLLSKSNLYCDPRYKFFFFFVLCPILLLILYVIIQHILYTVYLNIAQRSNATLILHKMVIGINYLLLLLLLLPTPTTMSVSQLSVNFIMIHHYSYSNHNPFKWQKETYLSNHPRSTIPSPLFRIYMYSRALISPIPHHKLIPTRV